MRALAACAAILLATTTNIDACSDALSCGEAAQFANNPASGEQPAPQTRHHSTKRLTKYVRSTPSRTLPTHPWITEARKYIGTNPTGLSHEWCARFANLVLDRSGYRGTGSDRADSFAHWGDPSPRFAAGAIAAGDHHVAFVVGCSRHGCTFISGNDYGRLVRQVSRDSSWVKWWRMPSGYSASAPLPRPRNTVARATTRPPPEPASSPDIEDWAAGIASAQRGAGGVPQNVATTGTAPTDTPLDLARAYLVRTAHPGATMARQGASVAIGLLQPAFAIRLADTFREARINGMPSAGVYSAYRPPGFGVGGFRNKFRSLHSVGLAVDVKGIGGPGSTLARRFHSIALKHKVYCIYGPFNASEWNHCQGTRLAVAPARLQATITSKGPKSREKMFYVAGAYLDVGPRRTAHSRHHRRTMEGG